MSNVNYHFLVEYVYDEYDERVSNYGRVEFMTYDEINKYRNHVHAIEIEYSKNRLCYANGQIKCLIQPKKKLILCWSNAIEQSHFSRILYNL